MNLKELFSTGKSEIGECITREETVLYMTHDEYVQILGETLAADLEEYDKALTMHARKIREMQEQINILRERLHV